MQFNQRRKRQYHKVPLENRQELLHQVFRENKKINVAAQNIGMNYAAAKSIIGKERKKKIKILRTPVLSNKQCSYKPVQNSSEVSYRIISQKFGEILSGSSYVNHQLVKE